MKNYLQRFFKYQDNDFWIRDIDSVDDRIDKWLIRDGKIDFDKIHSDYIKYRKSLDGYTSIHSFIFFLENNDKSPFKKETKTK